MSIGRRLADIRRRKSLNQVEFAGLLGVSQSAYKNYEREATDPPVALLLDISKTQKVNIGWLMLGEGAPDAESLKKLIERSVLEVELFLSRKEQTLSSQGKASAVSLVFEYLSEHPETSEKFLNSVMETALEKV